MYSIMRKIINPLNYKYKLFRLKGREIVWSVWARWLKILGGKVYPEKNNFDWFIPICRAPGTYLNHHDSAIKNHKFLLHATKGEAKLVKVSGDPLDLYF